MTFGTIGRNRRESTLGRASSPTPRPAAAGLGHHGLPAVGAAILAYVRGLVFKLHHFGDRTGAAQNSADQILPDYSRPESARCPDGLHSAAPRLRGVARALPEETDLAG